MEISQRTIEQVIGDSLHRHEFFPRDDNPSLVMMYPTWAGITEFERKQAQKLNQAGFGVVVIDFFGSQYDLSTMEARRDAMTSYTRDFPKMTKHLCLLNEWVLSKMEHLSAPVSVMGFCLGGMCAILSGLTQQGFANAISFHGLLSFPKETSPAAPATRFMILNGNADPMVPDSDIQATRDYFENQRLDLTFINFSGTMHSFSIPGAHNPEAGVQYNQDVAERSWRYAVDLLTQPVEE